MKKNAVLTEHDANVTWCPFVRTLNFQPAVDHNFPINRPEANFNCIASQCMAWRWHSTHVENPAAPKGDLIEVSDVYGFCGLAGTP